MKEVKLSKEQFPESKELTILHCKNCNTLLISRVNHDFSTCGCDNKSFIDGGSFSRYCRIGAIDFTKINTLVLYTNLSELELYNDWRYLKDELNKFDYSKFFEQEENI